MRQYTYPARGKQREQSDDAMNKRYPESIFVRSLRFVGAYPHGGGREGFTASGSVVEHPVLRAHRDTCLLASVPHVAPFDEMWDVKASCP